MSEFDVVIFGAGIAGASLAWQLAGERSVLLLESESQPGMHSTGRSAAMFMESYGPPAVRALTRASRAFYETPPEGFTPGPLLAPRGALYVATHGQEELLRETHDALIANCPTLDVLGPAEARQRASCLRLELIHGALYEPDAQDIDVHTLHQGFLRGLHERGGVLRCDASLRHASRDGERWLLRFEDGNMLRTRHVVDAAGAWAEGLAARFGAKPIGLVPKRRSAFTFKKPEGVDVSGWPCVAGVDESYYFKPDAGQLLGSPANAEATVPHDVRPEELDIALGIHQIEAVTTLQIHRPTSTWAGLRSFVPDGELVIGFDADCPGFFWLAGQGGYGIQSAAGASQLAASLLLERRLPESLRAQGVDARALSPARLR